MRDRRGCERDREPCVNLARAAREPLLADAFEVVDRFGPSPAYVCNLGAIAVEQELRDRILDVLDPGLAALQSDARFRRIFSNTRASRRRDGAS